MFVFIDDAVYIMVLHALIEFKPCILYVFL